MSALEKKVANEPKNGFDFFSPYEINFFTTPFRL